MGRCRSSSSTSRPRGRVFRVAPAGPPRRRRRAGAAAARGARPAPPGRRHRRRRRRRALASAAACGCVRSLATSRSPRCPAFHEPVELATFCSGTGPRWAERRTSVTGERGARRRGGRARGCSSIAAAGGRSRSTTTSSTIYGEAARRAAGAAAGSCTAAPPADARRAPVAAARERLRRARPREQRAVARGGRGRARPPPARATCRVRARSSTAARSNAATAVELAERGAASTATTSELAIWLWSTARCGCRRRRDRRRGSPALNRRSRTADRALDPMPVDAFAGRRCLVTGGLGFIGSNLALALARAVAPRSRCSTRACRATARTRATSCPTAATERRPARSRWSRPTSPTSTAPTSATRRVGADVVFNLAGQVSHVDSMDDPLFDLDVNTTSQFAFLELLRRENPAATVVLHVDPPDLRQAALPPGRRGAPGRAGRRQRHHEVRDRAAPPPLPRRLRPAGDARCGSPTCSGRASACATTSRASSRSSCAARSPTRRSRVFGDGAQERDCLYVDDVVECLLLAALAPDAAGRDLQRRQRRAPLAAARSPTRSSRAAGSGPGRARALAARPRRHRHRLVLRRLVEGEADARLGAAHVVRRRHRPHDRVLPRASAVVPVTDGDPRPRVPVVDLARRAARARARALGRGRRASCGPGAYLLGPELEAFEAEFAAFTGRRHAVGVASGTDALRLVARRARRRPGRRGDRARVHRGARPRPRCARPGATPGVRRRRPRHRGHRPGVGARPRSPTAPARSIPVHLYGRPAAIPDLGRAGARGRRAGARRARPRVAGRPPRRTASIPTKNLGGIGDGGAVVTDDDDLAATLRLLRAHGAHRRLRAHARSSTNARLSEVEAAALRVGLRRLAADNDRRREIAARYRAAAPGLRWQAPHERHVYHLCVARVADRDAFRARVPVRHRRALPAGAHPAARLRSSSCATPCPEAEAWAAECVSFPCFPEMTDDEIEAVCRATPVNPAVEADLGVLPLLQRRGHHRVDGRASRSRRSTRVGVSDGEVIVIDDGSTDGSAAGARRARRRASRCCASSPTSATAATAARCSRGSRPRRSSGSSTPTATASSTPPSSSCWCGTRPTTSTSCRATSCAAPTACCGAVIGRVYHRFVAFFFGLKIRDTDCDFRLIRRATLDRVELVHTTGVICVELVRKLQDAGARFTEVGVHHYRRVLRQVGVLPAAGAIARTLWDLAGLWVAARRAAPRARAPSRGQRVASTTTDVPNGHVVTGEPRVARRRPSGANTRSSARRSTSEPAATSRRVRGPGRARRARRRAARGTSTRTCARCDA